MTKCFSFLLICALAMSCGKEEQPAHDMSADVPSRELVIVDSIGVEMGDSCYMFGSIEGLRYDNDGNILLLDRAFSRIMVYGPSGEFLRSMGGEGEGPGEMNLTVLMVLTGGDDLLVSQRDAMEHYRYSTGEWIAEYPRGVTPPPFVMEGLQDSTFVGVHLEMVPDEDRLMGEVTLGTYKPGIWEPLVVIDSNRFELNPMNAAFLFEDVIEGYNVTSGLDGIIYASFRSGTDYLVTGYRPDGEQVFQLSREDVQPVEMTEEELAEEKEFLEAKLESMGAGDQLCSPDPLLPMISGLGIGPGGNLWVRRGNSRIPFFDIYDTSTGELLSTATLDVGPDQGRYWNIVVQPRGILAYSENPEEGFQKVYFLQ